MCCSFKFAVLKVSSSIFFSNNYFPYSLVMHQLASACISSWNHQYLVLTAWFGSFIVYQSHTNHYYLFWSNFVIIRDMIHHHWHNNIDYTLEIIVQQLPYIKYSIYNLKYDVSFEWIKQYQWLKYDLKDTNLNILFW